MSMENRHIIEQTVCDIAFGSEDEAFEQQADLGSFVTGRLLQVVDEVFTAMSVADKVFRIDALEIDLGTVAYNGFHEEMERRLRERLTAILQQKLPSLQAARTPHAPEGVMTRQRLELEQLAYFLVHGRMPWHADLGSGQTIEQILQRVMWSTGTQFKIWLQRLAHRDTVISRLVSQFPDAIRRDIVRLLAPSQARVLTAIVDDVRSIWKQHRFIETTERALGCFLWQECIDTLLHADRPSVDPRVLVRRIMQKLSLQQGGSYPRMLAILANETIQLQPRQGHGAVLTGLLQSLLQEEDRGQRAVSADALDIERWRARLAVALRRGAADGIADIWHTLVHEQPKLLQESLRYYGRQTEVRRQLASGFPEAMLKDIVGLLEPGGRDFIVAVIERPVLFQHASQEQVPTVDSLQGQLWEFTLTYVLVERGSRFNQRDYMGSLVRQMAAHNNLRYADLLRSMTSVLETIAVSHPLHSELLQLLGELAEERGDSQPAPEAPDHRSADVLHASDLYGELRQRLLQEAVPDAGDTDAEDRLARLIDALARVHPEQLLRLYRELQAGDLSWSQAAVTLSARELDRLIKALLALPYQGGAAGRADLLRAMTDYANRARDVKRYYGQLLACLVLDQVIDFDAILAENLAVDRDGGTIEASQGPTPQGEPPFPTRATDDLSLSEPEEPTAEAVSTALAPYLKSGGTVSAEAAARLSQTIERLLTRQPEQLRRFVESALAGRETAARLIDLLPERLLTRLLLLLRPAAHSWMHQCADSIATACHTPAIAAVPGHIGRLKWQYIFEYMCEAGGSFGEGTFVRRFADYVAVQLNWTDAAAFRALLSQQLVRTILPSTRERHLAIIRALAHRAEEEPRPEPEAPEAEPVSRIHGLGDEEPALTEDMYIANAGQVLAAPYFPRLFAMLDLTENTAFKDQRAAERAVHLLQFMVNGQTDSPEYQLVLNKILCGVRTGTPIDRAIDITDQERETIEGLIQGMIQNWKVIGNTSVAGLRESFLQREGRLQLQDDTWHLLVQPRAFDMLLDQLPWSFAIIKHPWMERVVHVDWR